MSLALPHSFEVMQDRLVRLLGSSVEGRSQLVAGLLRRDQSEATSYWLQLIVSVGIATLGLVVGSTAVVIGAMLVAPLLLPIVGLAMGLAIGSPFLVLRSAGRIGISVVIAVAGAAAITWSLPFYELNAEIAARTSPTVLDLAVAAFCAIAGVYASLRPGSDTATTAAGTSISISLVPPLCASGYGVGTVTWPVAGGAALLFLTNLVAIIVVGTVSFFLAGFNRVDVMALEHAELERGGGGAPLSRLLARRLADLFDSRWGASLRFLMPLALLGAVYVPLRSALDEVAWEVRVRAAVRESIAREPTPVVHSRFRVELREVEVVLVLLGTPPDAQRARNRIDAEIRQASGVAPRLEVLAVPDAMAVAGLESTLQKPQVIQAPAAAPPPPEEQLASGQAWVKRAVDDLWPEKSAGDLLAVEVATHTDGPFWVRLVHHGEPLSPDAAEAIGRAAQDRLGRETRLIDIAVPTRELSPERDELGFVAMVSAALQGASSAKDLSVCVTRPDPSATAARQTDLARTLDPMLRANPRATVVSGKGWTVRFVRGACPVPAQPAATPSSALPRR